MRNAPQDQFRSSIHQRGIKAWCLIPLNQRNSNMQTQINIVYCSISLSLEAASYSWDPGLYLQKQAFCSGNWSEWLIGLRLEKRGKDIKADRAILFSFNIWARYWNYILFFPGSSVPEKPGFSRLFGASERSQRRRILFHSDNKLSVFVLIISEAPNLLHYPSQDQTKAGTPFVCHKVWHPEIHLQTTVRKRMHLWIGGRKTDKTKLSQDCKSYLIFVRAFAG